MWRYLSLLIAIFLLTGALPAVAQEALYGRITAMDSESGRATLETLPTLFQPESKQVDIDFSPLERNQWGRLQTGDTIRVWVPTGTDKGSAAGVRTLQVHSSSGQQQSDSTGVRNRLSSPKSPGARGGSRSMMNGGGSGGRR